MQVSDLQKLLDAALHKTQNRISLTVTDLQGESHLRKLLASAIGAGRRNRMPLSEIQVSRSHFPALSKRIRPIPVTDSGDPKVLRLIYEPASAA